MSYWNLVLMWYGHMTAEYISRLMTEKELLGSKKQAAIKYIADQMHKTHYGYANERDMPWWITALEIINNIPVSNNRVVLDTAILIGSPKDENLAMKNLSILNEELAKENKRLEKEYVQDTVCFHNKWMEAEEKLKKQPPISDELLWQEIYSLREKLKIAVEAIKSYDPEFDDVLFMHQLNSADYDQLMEELSNEEKVHLDPCANCKGLELEIGAASDRINQLKEIIADYQTEKLKPSCSTAEWAGGKCCGYGKAENDDEPIDVCKVCPKQASYGVE